MRFFALALTILLVGCNMPAPTTNGYRTPPGVQIVSRPDQSRVHVSTQIWSTDHYAIEPGSSGWELTIFSKQGEKFKAGLPATIYLPADRPVEVKFLSPDGTTLDHIHLAPSEAPTPRANEP